MSTDQQRVPEPQRLLGQVPLFAAPKDGQCERVVRRLLVTDDGLWIVAAANDDMGVGHIVIVDTAEWRVRRRLETLHDVEELTIEGHELAFPNGPALVLPDGDLRPRSSAIASSDRCGRVRVLCQHLEDTYYSYCYQVLDEFGSPLLPAIRTGWPAQLVVSPDGSLLAVARSSCLPSSGDQGVPRHETYRGELWDLRSGQLLHQWPFGDLASALTFSPEQTFVLVTFGTARVRGCEVYEVASGRCVRPASSWDRLGAFMAAGTGTSEFYLGAVWTERFVALAMLREVRQPSNGVESVLRIIECGAGPAVAERHRRHHGGHDSRGLAARKRR